MTPDSGIRRAQIAGVPVDAVSMADIVQIVLDWTTGDRDRVAIGVNAHVSNLAARSRGFRKLVAMADLAYADGQSVVWAAKILGHPLPERIATTDLVYPLMEACAARGKRVFFYGGADGVAEKAADLLREAYPDVKIRTSHGFVPEADMPAVIHAVREHRTDVLLVGMGDPVQQEWIARYRDELGAAAILSCGGLFDWTSGANPRAPQWMIRAGLEWAWRLFLEPRRLARRYLVGNPLFVLRVVRQSLRRRDRP
jgi:N-acetylglucosaminyldiphosphoundecaprenol N-acetyl-beta-D-mannosaminyltransferase